MTIKNDSKKRKPQNQIVRNGNDVRETKKNNVNKSIKE